MHLSSLKNMQRFRESYLEALTARSIALTPHQTEPEIDVRGVIDNEICSLKHGVFNLGFIGVANTEAGRRFAHWWRDRLLHFCRAEPQNGLFTDQKWIDLVPALFDDYVVLKSPRFNVATWNIRTRPMTWSAETGYQVAGLPLGFYHFTGLDSGAHRIMLARYAVGSPDAQKLLTWYEKKEQETKGDPLTSIPWCFGMYSDGARIQKHERIIYRERMDLQRAFPNPFDVANAGFRAWVEGQGRLDFPALFDAVHGKAALIDLTSNVTPGFRAEMPDTAPRLVEHLRMVAKSPSSNGRALVSQLLRVWRQGGCKAVLAKWSAMRAR